MDSQRLSGGREAQFPLPDTVHAPLRLLPSGRCAQERRCGLHTARHQTLYASSSFQTQRCH